MKTARFIVAVAVALSGFILSANVMGMSPEEQPEASLPEAAHEAMPEVMPEPVPEGMHEVMPETNLQQDLPEKHHIAGEINYISGGVSHDEASGMKQLARDYLLEVVFVQKTHRSEAYLAEVKLQIKDAKGNIVLDIATEGPIFLANLPPGNYLISAEYNNLTKTNRALISARKHQRIVFLWPIAAEGQ